jgi:hypothetical protein
MGEHEKPGGSRDGLWLMRSARGCPKARHTEKIGVWSFCKHCCTNPRFFMLSRRGAWPSGRTLHRRQYRGTTSFKNKIGLSVKLFYFKTVLEGDRHGMATDAFANVPSFGPAYFTIRAYDTPELRPHRVFGTRCRVVV